VLAQDVVSTAALVLELHALVAFHHVRHLHGAWSCKATHTIFTRVRPNSTTHLLRIHEWRTLTPHSDSQHRLLFEVTQHVAEVDICGTSD